MRPSTLLAFLPLAIAAPSPAPIKRDSPAPLITPRGNKGVPNRFIVRMVDGIKESSMSSSMKSLKTSSHFKYSKSFNGFAATLDEDQLAAIRENPNVEYVEQEQIMQIYETQQDATWGISRLSSQTPGATTYSYDAAAGEGTCAYVLDTGIDVAHPEFEGRATWAANFASGNSTRDVQGHGTHCAGTIGSKTYGVAKKTKLFAVKVLGDDGSGTTSGVVAGMEWVVKNADKSKCPNGIVINMSLGGSYSRAINDAAAAIADSGFFLAVAAGNSAVDASTSSPASEPKACTVGASDSSDKIAYFSNFGKLVDIFAPGVKIQSTFPGGRTKVMNGTSMASPHVAGLGAYLLSIGQKADGLCDYIAKTGLKNAISGVPNGTVSTLANNGFSGQ